MTANEIDMIAKTRQPLPAKANITESGLYYILLGIYRAYDAQEKTADEARHHKQEVIEEYEHITALQRENTELSRRISQDVEIFARDDRQRIHLAPLIAQANKQGCSLCKEIAKVYDGRITK